MTDITQEDVEQLMKLLKSLQPEIQETPSQYICPSCGKVLDKEWVACPECGWIKKKHKNKVNEKGRNYTILSCTIPLIGFIIFPYIFGIMGIIAGVAAIKEKNYLGIIGICLSILVMFTTIILTALRMV
jgi:hypothetical protein